jgi:RNA polymerase sigma factor (sigma-70 family)
MSGEKFEALLAPNLRCVRMLVRRRIPSTGPAEDVVQNILLRAFANRNQLRFEEKFGNWLWSIAANEIRQHFRVDRRLVSLDEIPRFDAPDAGVSPLARLQEKETCEWVEFCVAKLPDRDRNAIRIRDLEGKTLEETAAALQSSLPGAKTIHFRARKRLARILRATAQGRGGVSTRAAA